VKRLLVVTLWVGASLAAALLHLPAFSRPQSAFQRGSYAVLLDAEEALAKGRAPEALSLLRAAYIRARYESQSGVAERIRHRMAAVGRELLSRDPQKAWPFFETAVLLSADFSRDALAAEDLILSNPATARRRFEYRLTGPSGVSAWGSPCSSEWTALWPRRKRWESLHGGRPSDGLFADYERTWPSARYGLTVSLYLQRGAMEIPGRTMIEAPGAGLVKGCWFDFPRQHEFRPATAAGNSRWVADGLPFIPYGGIPRIVVFTDSLPPKGGIQVLLIREYESI
jgi:hypothetical protein